MAAEYWCLRWRESGEWYSKDNRSDNWTEHKEIRKRFTSKARAVAARSGYWEPDEVAIVHVGPKLPSPESLGLVVIDETKPPPHLPSMAEMNASMREGFRRHDAEQMHRTAWCSPTTSPEERARVCEVLRSIHGEAGGRAARLLEECAGT